MSETRRVHLHQSAREILAAALVAVDARVVTRSAINVAGTELKIVDTAVDAREPIFVVSVGKAGMAMAEAINEKIGDRLTHGIITSQEKATVTLSEKWQTFSGGHPLPNSESLNAAAASFQLLERANAEEAFVIFAISGGGSAMIEWPVTPDISLGDLQTANRLLVSCGATIAEINTVRRAFSAVKGGKLAGRAPRAGIVTLLISDTNEGDEASVASGPTMLPPSGLANASEIVARYRLESALPTTIVRAIAESSESAKFPLSDFPHYVLAQNRTAIDAAVARAQSLGFRAVVAGEISEQEIAKGCEQLLARLETEAQPVCVISGGEFSCPVRGEGRGGRNLETVLRCAIALDRVGTDEHMVVLSAGTDGIDGNSQAAGALADETTMQRARELGLSGEDFLARSDSYTFFESLGDTVITGTTGTNVRDLRVLLKVGSDSLLNDQ